MPPSPALRYSPGRDPRADGHKRRHSLESGLLLREKDDDLALFNEMQSKERESFLLHSSDDLEDAFSTKLRHFSDAIRGISIPGQGKTSDLLNADGDKNDYDWLLTPPDTPLFPSLDVEPPPMNVASRGRPQSKPISITRSSTMEKSYRSSRGSASPNRLSPSPRSGTNTLQPRGRPSSVPNSSPTPSLWHASPSRRQSTPPKSPSSRSKNSTPMRMSTGSSGAMASSGIRGTSPVKTGCGNSASPKIRAWQTNIPGLSSEAPPNLRTSLADRPASYVRGSSPASRKSRDSTSKSSRQSMSPSASRSNSSFRCHDRDQFSSRSKGSVASSGDDDIESTQSTPMGNLDRQGSIRSGFLSTNKTPIFSKKSARMASPNSAPKRLFDSAIGQMDRKSPQNMFRPLLSSVPSTTFYVGKANSAHHSLVSRNSSVTTSSNTSSDQGTNFAVDTVGSEEVFAFDKIETLNENEESVNIQHNEMRDPTIVFYATESEDSVRHGGNDTEGNENSEISRNQGLFHEVDGSENTAICYNCRCCYEATEQAEKGVALCPECTRKITLLRVIIPDRTLAVSKDSLMISENMPEEEKTLSLSETNRLTVASEPPQDSDVDELRFRLNEQDAEECQTSCSELINDRSQNSPLPSSSADGGAEMNQSGLFYEKPNNDFGDQKLHLYGDPPNLNVNLMEGTGISVLLKRSSSNKGPVLQGRSFTATTISYDDLSLARDSGNITRSSTRHSSYSASSSVDLSSVRQTEFCVQRQLSDRKLDVNCGHGLQCKPPSTGSSFSSTSNHSHHGLLLATLETSGNTDCGFVEEMPQVLRELRASEITVADVPGASSVSLVAVEEDKFECDDNSKVTNTGISEILDQDAVIVQSDDNSVVSFLNVGDCVSYENVENDPNNASRSPFHEKHDVQNSNVDESYALVPAADSSKITESEIEGGENNCENNTGTVNGDLSLVSKSALDEFQELPTQSPSNDCITASLSELNTSEYSHGIGGSTVTVECQGAGNTKSLTLEEATDTILFCSSIIHDLAYKAATTAIEKECPDDPYEVSEPAVTFLRQQNSNRKDTRSRSVTTRASKPHKARQRRVIETNAKPSSGKTENDENIDESFTHNQNNVGLDNKVDSNSMKPPKLESKCNCIIM